MWDTLGKLGEDQQKQAAWLINQKALQPFVETGAPFEYTLKRVDNVKVEEQVVKLIWQGKGETEIIKNLDAYGITSLKVRWRELLELHQAGYQQSFDEAANAYKMVKP